MNFIKKLSFFLVLLSLINACKEKSSIETKVSSSFQIISSQIADDGKAIRVFCTGHNEETKIVINGIKCETIYNPNHLICMLPNELEKDNFANITIELYNQPRKSKQYRLSSIIDSTTNTLNSNNLEIEIISYGFGGEDNSAVWIQCINHTETVKVFINNQESETVYYSDYVTATIPRTMLDKSELVVQLIDQESKLVSPKFSIIDENKK